MTNERKRLTRLVQDAIDRGATTIEETHKSIANLPIRVLEESDLLREPAKKVRDLQNRTIGSIYDVIRKINQQIGNVASEVLDRSAKRRHARTQANGNHAVASQPRDRGKGFECSES